jgi:endonuclease V-like protein UPF0215 family
MKPTLFDIFIKERVEIDCKDATEEVKNIYAGALEIRIKNIINEGIDTFC